MRRGGPEPETLIIRDEWRGPDAERVLHYKWTGITAFIIDPGLLISDSDGELHDLFRDGEPHGGPTGGGGHGQDDGDDPPARFRGPLSVSPSPSIADDNDLSGDGGGGAAASMSMQQIAPMDDDQHE